jgi:hypothetical protein
MNFDRAESINKTSSESQEWDIVRKAGTSALLMSNPHRQSVSGAGTDIAFAKIYFGRKLHRAKSSKLLPLPRKLIFLASAPRPRMAGDRDRAGRKSRRNSDTISVTERARRRRRSTNSRYSIMRKAREKNASRDHRSARPCTTKPYISGNHSRATRWEISVCVRNVHYVFCRESNVNDKRYIVWSIPKYV